MRDLTRAREDAVRALKIARQQLGAFLLRYGKRYPGQGVVDAGPYAMVVRYRPSSSLPADRLAGIHSDRSGWHRPDHSSDGPDPRAPSRSGAWHPVVKALQALRGVAPIVATTTMAEIGDMSRFENPRQLMAYLGLIPSEDSSGETTHRGPHYQDGERTCPPSPGRGGACLHLSGPGEPASAQAAGGSARVCPGDCLEGAGEALRQVPAADGEGETEERRW